MNKEQELKRKKSPVSIKNKKASFEYFFVETYTAGIAYGHRDQVDTFGQGKSCRYILLYQQPWGVG